MSMKRFPTKGTGESVVLSFDFSRETTAVSSPVFECVVDHSVPGDPSPAAVLEGAPGIDSINSALVLQRVQGGVDRTDYRIECTVQTDSGDILTLGAILPVRERV